MLIVDDSKFSQILAHNLFKEKNKDMEFIFANDGIEGLEAYKAHKPNYCIIDLLMPRMNGHELIKLIKEYDKDAKIFVASADVQKSVKEEVLSYGIIDFINKPLNIEKINSICEMIEGDSNGS